MGCIKSVEQHEDEKAPITNISTSPITQQPDIIKAAEAPAEKTTTGPVVDVPRAQVVVTDEDRLQLKLMTMKDRLEDFLMNADATMAEEAKFAIQAKKEGNMAMYNVFVRRRAILKERVKKQEAMSVTISKQVEALTDAQGNRQMLQAVESGTQAINEVMKDLSVSRVQQAMKDNREAMAYVKEVEQMVAAENVEDADLSDAMAELEQFEKDQQPADVADADKAETAAQKTEQIPDASAQTVSKDETALQKAEKIPDVPTQVPNKPVVEAAPQAEPEKSLEAA